ncbi:hypothetical protein BCR44DRAFT_1223453 [Catenaria anguillulae PL171]|uniref:Uncharacterized protein n=1 Tax=Catenaria anguillulae PL171 TaxID=765915 RepID=A0A1Y2HGK0_9FUNG|nr:hypothetical protein BCR44DRAFT_1223453 [Catenaria anguillulae PL171]
MRCRAIWIGGPGFCRRWTRRFAVCAMPSGWSLRMGTHASLCGGCSIARIKRTTYLKGLFSGAISKSHVDVLDWWISEIQVLDQAANVKLLEQAAFAGLLPILEWYHTMFPQAPPEATVCTQAIDRASAFGYTHNLDGWLNKSSWPFGYSGRALEPRIKQGLSTGICRTCGGCDMVSGSTMACGTLPRLFAGVVASNSQHARGDDASPFSGCFCRVCTGGTCGRVSLFAQSSSVLAV